MDSDSDMKSRGGGSGSLRSSHPDTESSDGGGGGGEKAESAPNLRIIQGGSNHLKNWRRKGSEWEILGSLERGTEYTIKPKPHEGYMYKKRKWPLKGWHKRYFSLHAGILTYGKSSADLSRGRVHGRINIGQAVVSFKRYRIDINDEECIHHLKVENVESFALWMEQIKQHRLYQQNLVNSVISSPLSDHLHHLDHYFPRANPPPPPPVAQTSSSSAGTTSSTSTLTSPKPWTSAQIEFHSMDENVTNHLLNIQQQVVALSLLAQRCEDEHTMSSTNPKQKKLFGLRKKKSSNNGTSKTSPGSEMLDSAAAAAVVVISDNSSSLTNMSSLSSSNPSISSSISRPTSLDGSTLKPPKEELMNLAEVMQRDVRNLMKVFSIERDKLKAAIDALSLANEAGATGTTSGGGGTLNLRQSLNQALQQNSILRARLQKIHMDSDVSELTDTLPRSGGGGGIIGSGGGMNHSLSYSSSCISEFFDAREYMTAEVPSEYSSDEESEEEEEASPDDEKDDENLISSSDDDQAYEEAQQSSRFLSSEKLSAVCEESITLTGRRQKLPVPKTETEGLNLWNLLCKNIGKDLSKISMPVTLNEPLSTLQRLCEELEYSDILDKAASAASPMDRMMWVAAFAVSTYGSSNARAGHKPFNPLLGETYECVREDRGFKYIAEQVSHHPPISSCHATSNSWTWYQDLRVKTKFWGKSMEFQPEGTITLELKVNNSSSSNVVVEKYTWNKITTCIHNLFGSERCVDLYGQMNIVCCTNGLTCKIDFIKGSYWSSKKHEVFGTIVDNGKVVQTLFGKWSEGLYCGKAPSARCIWRPGALPEDSALYYGFSRFAIELNELLESEKDLLPITDTRFRPDQRQLEMGNITEAETLKLKLEQLQRERKYEMETSDGGYTHTPMWFEKATPTQDGGQERWVFNNRYWKCRQNPGFANMKLQKLW